MLVLLGPVELACAEPVELGSAKQRCVLAALAFEPGKPVPVELLIERVWGDQQPNSVRAAVYSYVSKLRRPLRAAGLPEPERTPCGYQLALGADQVDIAAFRRLTDLARDETDLRRRGARLREALALWRGEPLSGLSGNWVERVRNGLTQGRLSALVERIEVDIRLSETGELVDELTALVAQHPLVETFTGQLMRVLHAHSRRAEALAAFQTLRERLADELGTDPSPGIDRIHQHVLRAEDTAIPAELPANARSFTGREHELAQLDEAVSRSRLALIVGPAGIGKSGLALHWAQNVRYPDGQVYVDLRGFGCDTPVEPGHALDRLLRVLGAHVPGDLDEKAALFRSIIARRKAVLVLDNAATVAQVRPLLPGAAGLAVLITSRNELRGLSASHDVHRIVLDTLPEPDSVGLLRKLLGDRVATREELTELAELCGRLPLALRIAAVNLAAEKHVPIEEYLARLRTVMHRTGERVLITAKQGQRISPW